jgi:hypothetical protein
MLVVRCSCYVAARPLSSRDGCRQRLRPGQWAAIPAGPLHELSGFKLAIDCLAPRCNGARTFAEAELARIYSWDARRSVGFLARSAFRPWLLAVGVELRRFVRMRKTNV